MSYPFRIRYTYWRVILNFLPIAASVLNFFRNLINSALENLGMATASLRVSNFRKYNYLANGTFG